MILLILLAIGILIFAFFYLQESGLFKKKVMFDATVVDESEDELYDNLGGVKVRFYKVYEYFDGQENCIVKSERPMKKIDDDTGRGCRILVDEKNRKAMEVRDVIRYRVYALILAMIATTIIVGVWWIVNFVPGAVLW